MPGQSSSHQDLVAKSIEDFWRCFPFGREFIKSEYLVAKHHPNGFIRGIKTTDNLEEAKKFADFNSSDVEGHTLVYSKIGYPLYKGKAQKGEKYN